jgi:YidC/Oxa1 family membrane protein insertase
MLHTFWTAIFYQPFYNALIFGIGILPRGDLGLAVIILTLIIKFALFPLNQRAIEGQIKMNSVQDEVAAIKANVTDKTEQNKQIFALYKDRNISPFSSCMPLLIQAVVLIALYRAFLGILTIVQPAALYSFVHQPALVNLHFLGFIDLSVKHSIIFALLVGVTQFVQAKLMQSRQAKPTGTGMQAEFARNMQVQMIYGLPIMTAGLSYFLFPSAVALYWITSNIFTIGQELYTRRKMKAKTQA